MLKDPTMWKIQKYSIKAEVTVFLTFFKKALFMKYVSTYIRKFDYLKLPNLRNLWKNTFINFLTSKLNNLEVFRNFPEKMRKLKWQWHHIPVTEILIVRPAEKTYCNCWQKLTQFLSISSPLSKTQNYLFWHPHLLEK